MKTTVLVIGINENTTSAADLTRAATAKGLHAVFLDNWSRWRISLDCKASKFVLRSASAVVHSCSVHSVAMFGLPECPSVDERERAYQEAEYTAILVGMLFALRHPLMERWRCLISSLSDAEISESDLSIHPQFEKLRALFQPGGGVEDALWLGGVLHLRQLDGSVTLVNEATWAPRGDLARVPVRLTIDHDRRAATPFVGLLPQWPRLPPTVMDYILTPYAESRMSRGDLFNESGEPVHACQPLIAAHQRDTTASYLRNVAQDTGRTVDFIDLTSLYLEGCANVGARLEQIVSAKFLIARPIMLPEKGPKGERYSAQTGMRTLRHVEANRGIVLGRPSGAFSNDSKPAHLIELGWAGWRFPETIVTNDPDAALEEERGGLQRLQLAAQHRHAVRREHARTDRESKERSGSVSRSAPAPWRLPVAAPYPRRWECQWASSAHRSSGCAHAARAARGTCLTSRVPAASGGCPPGSPRPPALCPSTPYPGGAAASTRMASAVGPS